MKLLFLISLLLSTVLSEKLFDEVKANDEFDPEECYEPGTNFDENQKNLGYCPCKYGFGGPKCFDIFDCVIGELRIDNCSREFHADFDLQWRCAASKSDIVKICTCPEEFRGETCEYIVENTPYTYWMSVKQSQRFFEIVYNKSHSLGRIIGTRVVRLMMEYRRFILFLIFVLIAEAAWKAHKRLRNQNEIKKEKKADKKLSKLRELISKLFCRKQKKYVELKTILVKGKEEKNIEKQNEEESARRASTSSDSSLPSYKTVMENRSEVVMVEEDRQQVHSPCIHV